MGEQESIKIDVKQILQQKAPSMTKKIPGFLINYLIKIVHQDEINWILKEYRNLEGVDAMNALVEYFNLTLHLQSLEHIPTKGRFIFASNHPLGGLDGICLSSVIGNRFDGNIRYLVNDILMYLPNFRSIFVPINKHGAQGRQNASLIEEAYRSENQIVTFPAGLCSRKIKGQIQDLEWKKSFIQKAIEYERDIIPVFFSGRNSHFFYNFARIRKALGIKMNYEMLYLPDEMFRAKNSTFTIYFGEPIAWQTFDKSKNLTEWAEYVRNIVYRLRK